MANCLLSWVNRLDASGVVFTAGSEVSKLPVQNIVDPVVQKVWRTSAATTSYFEADLGSALSMQILALFGCNLAATDTIRWRLSTANPTDGDVYDSGVIACGTVEGYGAVVKVLAAAVSARYIRADIVATSRTADGYFDVGRAWAGDFWQPDKNASYGLEDGWQDSSVITVAPDSGVEHIDYKPKRRTVAFGLEMLSDTERDEIKEMDRIVGISDQIVFTIDSASSSIESEIILGRLSRSTPLKYADFNINSKVFEIRQSL